MKKLKACLHLHVKGDRLDHIEYTPKEAIKKAAKCNFDVIAITCHDIVIRSRELDEFAKRRGILLMPGIEKTILGKHVLILNAHPESERIESFTALREYKNAHPESCIAAPHPFHLPPFPASFSLGEKLYEHADLFDAVEFNYYYTKRMRFNAPAEAFAKKYGKPLIGTSDVHNLFYMDKTSCIIKSEKTTEAVIEAIKKDAVELITQPLTLTELFKITAENFIINRAKKILGHGKEKIGAIIER